MIAKLIDLCVKNRLLVLLLAAVLIGAGVWAAQSISVDAIPDLSDVQVILSAEYTGQNPQIVQDQVTYPLTRSMLGLPRAKVVRGISLFGVSFVYIIFEDGTDPNWARSRVLERLSYITGSLPRGVAVQLGPDATGVGWVYEYVLTTGPYCPKHAHGLYLDPQEGKWYAPSDRDRLDPAVAKRLVLRRVLPAEMKTCPLDGSPVSAPQQSLADLRSLQDWFLRYELTSVHGVSEVASVGGFVKQYQVVVDPRKLQALNIPLEKVRQAVERSNANAGGRVIEISEREYAVQGVGYLGTLSEQEMRDAATKGESVGDLRTARVIDDLRNVSLGVAKDGSALHLYHVAEVRIGPQMRRGIAEWNGQGEAVGGVIVMRNAENARATIEGVRARLAQLQDQLPPGVAVEPAYDRGDLIDRAVETLRSTLLEEITVVALVCIFFLLHARSELVAVFVVPTGVLGSLLVMHLLGINANVMSLGGIAIAIGVMVDSSIVMVENAHKHLDAREDLLHAAAREGKTVEVPTRQQAVAEAAREVGPSLFFALLILTVSFLPVFVLGDQPGRLFKPLAFTKTFAMAWAALLAVTVIPVLMSLLITARVLPREWGWARNLALTLAAMFVPAALLLVVPLGALAEYRYWVAGGWAVVAGMLLVPQKILHENVNPVSRLQQRIYEPLFRAALRLRWGVLTAGAVVVTWVLLLIATVVAPAYFEKSAPWAWNIVPRFGSEFMPPLEEGDLLYMPTTPAGISMSKARELLQQTDRMLMQFPEVESVMGKAGRAETATDPAPVSMFETTISLHRDKSRWRTVPVERFYSDWPSWAQALPRLAWPDWRPITRKELVEGYTVGGVHVKGLDETVQVPGLTNSWTMPIRTRIDMLSTGIKTPVGVKVMGPDLRTITRLADEIAAAIKTDGATGPVTRSAYAENMLGGTYIDVTIRRDDIARYNLNVQDVQEVIATALGGMDVTQTVEGLERYPVNLRYPQEFRDSIAALGQTLVADPTGAQIPLAQLADFRVTGGPDMIRSENARPSGWVYLDISTSDIGGYVRDAREAVARRVALPAGYSIAWSGQYEYMEEASARLAIVVPITLAIVVLLLYVATRSWLRVCIVLLAVPFSLLGAFVLTWWLGYDLSLAVWVGMIALAGLDVETGLVMLLYLDNSYERFARRGQMRSRADLWQAVHDGAVKRIRPKTMTVATAFVGLLPLLWAKGAGGDTMARLAAPMIGGLITSFVLELLVYPVVFYIAKGRRLPAADTTTETVSSK